jgi:integrase
MGPRSYINMGVLSGTATRQFDNLILPSDTGGMKRPKTDKKSAWQKTQVSNLVRYTRSSIYFARIRVRGKLIRKSLKTKVFTVAQVKLADFAKEQRSVAEMHGAVTGKMTCGEALAIYEKRLAENTRLKPGAKIYRHKTINALIKSWPGLKERELKAISQTECLTWVKKFHAAYSVSVFNNTVDTLRHILEVGVQEGARYGNPASAIKKARVMQRELTLPENKNFLKMVRIVENGGGRFSRPCANLIRFLAFGGFRKGEAADIVWGDCDFAKGEIVVRGDAKTGTKNWSVRRVPMIQDMKHLLQHLKAERPNESADMPVMRVRECQKAMDRAAEKLKIHRITHHDLRHLFATRCIESGVDIPTVSRWLGHKDGGALAMKVYGHLRDQHSSNMAKLVSFTGKPPKETDNVDSARKN